MQIFNEKFKEKLSYKVNQKGNIKEILHIVENRKSKYCYLDYFSKNKFQRTPISRYEAKALNNMVNKVVILYEGDKYKILKYSDFLRTVYDKHYECL